MLPDRARPAVAAAVGLTGVGAVTVLCRLVDGLPSAIPALLLLVPISIAGVLGGTFVAVAVAVIAAITFTVAFLPPYGAVKVDLAEDIAVLLTFVAVAVLVAIVSDTRRQRARELRVLDDRRAAMLRTVSHDLRSPLTTIRSVSSELLDGTEYDARTRATLLGYVVDESERLDRIVGNLLSASKIQAGALQPDLARCDLGDVVRGCAEHSKRAAVPGPHVRPVIASNLPQVLADPVQIDQVLTNLIENARRAAPPASEIVVSAAPADHDFVSVTVDDDGPGFSNVDHDHLFQPFQSASGSSGLGLSVCKAIVEAHGGTIKLGASPSGGASVRFTVPVAVGA